MSNKEWETIGRSIVDLVETAIDSKEFRQLNQTLTSTVVTAAKSAEKGLSVAKEKLEEQERIRTQYITKDNIRLFKNINGTKASGIVLMIVGFVLAGSFAFAGIPLVLGSLLLADMFSFVLFLSIFGVLGLGSLFMGLKGTSLYNKTKRFHTYIKALQGRSYTDLSVLVNAVRKTSKVVLKDLQEMIKKGWFIEGHLDHKNQTLMVTHETYNEYLRTLKVQQEQARKQKEEAKKANFKPNVTPEIQEILETGNAYVLEMRRCNDAIPGEEISNKIDRIELVVKKIFKRVEQHPENVNDIRKFMKYYLPTTIKLLKAYEELDAQPVQGENILNSKQEIEKTLDTLNVAFEKLLDEMFRETAWDVSSDITVLETMLAQEGLTKNGL